MWLLINDTLNNEHFLIQAGRSLCICQKFETTCKDILMLLSSAKSIKDKRFSLLDEDYIKNLRALLSLQLGKSIEKYQNDFSKFVNKKEIETLSKGKDSRNFICHDLMKDLIAASFSDRPKSICNMGKFKEHVKNIAKADYLVSKWSYEFQEQISGDFFYPEIYVNRLVNWVLN